MIKRPRKFVSKAFSDLSFLQYGIMVAGNAKHYENYPCLATEDEYIYQAQMVRWLRALERESARFKEWLANAEAYLRQETDKRKSQPRKFFDYSYFTDDKW